jgi:preprotein translocase subunit SecB
MLPPIRLSSYPVRPVSVFLVDVSLRPLMPIDLEEPAAPNELGEGQVGVTITLGRVAERLLIVTVTLHLENNPYYEGHASYGGRFQMSESVPPEEMEETWRQVARELAPVTLYPFLRELFLNLTGRTLSPSVVLPFGPIPLEGEIEIPTTDAEQRVLQFESSSTYRKTHLSAAAESSGAKRKGSQRKRKSTESG